MSHRLTTATLATPEVVATAELALDSRGEGFTDITADVHRFLADAGAGDGAALLFLRHTSASLTIQENADPDVLRDLTAALRQLAPRDFGWIHDTEGPDDMPAHVRTMLTGLSLHVPVLAGRVALGAWQGVYLIEHRELPHHRRLMLQFIGSKAARAAGR